MSTMPLVAVGWPWSPAIDAKLWKCRYNLTRPDLEQSDHTLLLATYVHSILQAMGSVTGTERILGHYSCTFWVTREGGGYTKQVVRWRVYVQLKMELCFFRTRDLGKIRDTFYCRFCKRTWNHNMRCSKHRLIRCPLGPVDWEGNKILAPSVS